MQVFKDGGHRLFQSDPECAEIVSKMLADLEKRGMDAVREYSKRFDDWCPAEFELSTRQVEAAITAVDPQVIEDTDFCQANVRAFAQAQLSTMRPLEVEMRPGIILGHKHVPITSVGSYIPGGRYPCSGRRR